MNVDVEACEGDQDTLKGMFKSSNNSKAYTYRIVVDFDFRNWKTPLKECFVWVAM